MNTSNAKPLAPDDERLNPPNTGRPTAEMLLSLPRFITGEIMFGTPEPITYYSDGETIRLNAKAINP